MIELPIAGTSQTYTVNPEKIIALGLNYKEHIEESVSVKVKGFTKEIPKEPVLFNKTPNTLCSSGDAILLPAVLEDYSFEAPRTDYEGELAVIIGKGGKFIKAANAYSHILGYTCLNDVSQRNIQTSDKPGWFRGKSFDTFAPIGPVLVPQENIGNPHDLKIETRLNGNTVQSSNTKLMIFLIPEIISFVSRNFTLREGDIISTGTPSGVGPLSPGDTVEVEIEKIGILKNSVKQEHGV
ncbi:MAG: fumarylacetoacetate hydrolase family protein [Spirochaetia bacterium]